MHFGKAVKKLMDERMVTVQQLADQLGCHRQNIYETIKRPSAQLQNVQVYAKALKVKPFELVQMAEKLK